MLRRWAATHQPEHPDRNPTIPSDSALRYSAILARPKDVTDHTLTMSRTSRVTSSPPSKPIISLYDRVPADLVAIIFPHLRPEAIRSLLPDCVLPAVYTSKPDHISAPPIPPRWWYQYLARIVGLSTIPGEGELLSHEREDENYYALVVGDIVLHRQARYLLMPLFGPPPDYYWGEPEWATMRDMWPAERGGELILESVSKTLAANGGVLLRTVYALASVVGDSNRVYGVLQKVIRDGMLGSMTYWGRHEPVVRPGYDKVATTLLGWLEVNGWLQYIPQEYASRAAIRWDVILSEEGRTADSSTTPPPPFGVRLLHALFRGYPDWWKYRDGGAYGAFRNTFNDNTYGLRGIVSLLSDEILEEMHRFLTYKYPMYSGAYNTTDSRLFNHPEIVRMLATLERARTAIHRAMPERLGYGSYRGLEDWLLR